MARHYQIHIRDALPLHRVAGITFKGIELQQSVSEPDFSPIFGEGFIAGVGSIEEDNYPDAYDHIGRYLLGEQFRRGVSFRQVTLDENRQHTEVGYANILKATFNWFEFDYDVALTYGWDVVLMAQIAGQIYINDGRSWKFAESELKGLNQPYVLRGFPRSTPD